LSALRVAIAGFGLAGEVFHAPLIASVDGLEVASVLTRSPERAARAEAAYPGVRVADDVEGLLEGIDVLVVATPNSSHVPVALAGIERGLAVVVDKPLAPSAADARRLLDAGGRITVFQNRRWDGDFLTVRKLVEDERLGRLVMFESHYDRFRQLPRLHAWREDGGPGGGVLFDLGAHMADQALVLFGVPASVWASVRIEREGARSDDAFDLYLHYPASHARAEPSGLSVWLRATCLARSPGARFTLNGTLGTFRKFGMDPQEAHLLAGDVFSSKPWGVEGPEHWGTLTLDEGGEPVSTRIPTEAGDYRGYYMNIRDAMHGNAALEVTPLQAWRTMRVLEMALESSRTGNTIACDWTQEP
jgi:predicted dehydrogenase